MLAARRHALRDRRSVAALEFAIVAPVLLTLVLGATDGARALLIKAQIHNAANAIAEAAEKLSVTIDPGTGKIVSELTPAQMQQAMSTIYAEIPGLDLGRGDGLFPGQYSVTLTSTWFYPTCKQATGCAPQYPWVLWTSALTVGGPQLISTFLRPCGIQMQYTTFLDNVHTYSFVLNPNLNFGATPQTLPPEIIVDVQYDFTPYFLYFMQGSPFFASAEMPSPVGDLTTAITVNSSGGTAGVTVCP